MNAFVLEEIVEIELWCIVKSYCSNGSFVLCLNLIVEWWKDVDGIIFIMHEIYLCGTITIIDKDKEILMTWVVGTWNGHQVSMWTKSNGLSYLLFFDGNGRCFYLASWKTLQGEERSVKEDETFKRSWRILSFTDDGWPRRNAIYQTWSRQTI